MAPKPRNTQTAETDVSADTNSGGVLVDGFVDVTTVNTSGQTATVRLPEGHDMVRHLGVMERRGELRSADVGPAVDGPQNEAAGPPPWRRRGAPVGDGVLLSETLTVAVAPVAVKSPDDLTVEELTALAAVTGATVNDGMSAADLRKAIDDKRSGVGA